MANCAAPESLHEVAAPHAAGLLHRLEHRVDRCEATGQPLGQHRLAGDHAVPLQQRQRLGVAALGWRAALADQVGGQRPAAGGARRTRAGRAPRPRRCVTGSAAATARAAAAKVSLVTSPDQTRSHSASSSSSSVRASRTATRSAPKKEAPRRSSCWRMASCSGPVRPVARLEGAGRGQQLGPVAPDRAPPGRRRGRAVRARSRPPRPPRPARRAGAARSRARGRAARRAPGSRRGSGSPPAGR